MSDETSTALRIWLGLFALSLGVFAVHQDHSAMYVCLPAIERELGADFADAQWVINAYMLVFSVLVVAGGRLADSYGRRRVFFTGGTVFISASLLGALSPNVFFLIIARALTAIGGALFWSSMLGMAYTSLPKEKVGIVGGVLIGAAGLGDVVGPVVAGTVTQLLAWTFVLTLNLPFIALAAIATWLMVKEESQPEGKRIDMVGTACFGFGLFALLMSLNLASDFGWATAGTLSGVALAIVSFSVFYWLKKRGKPNALIPLDVAKNRELSSALVIAALGASAFFATLLMLQQFLQKALSLGAQEAGIFMLPMMSALAIVSFAAGPIYDRIGAKLSVSIGAVFVVLGMLLLSLVGAKGDYNVLLVAMIVTGGGFGVFLSSIMTTGTTAVDPKESSLASGLIYMSRNTGGAIGIGAAATIISLVSASKITTEAASLGLSGLTHSQIVAIRGLQV
ncbi:MAG TPA: MFS transporter [Terriglobales bacterium]|nr:MFS transporter [Terriglobales bacterium]